MIHTLGIYLVCRESGLSTRLFLDIQGKANGGFNGTI